jgi:hypothetical protein
VDKERNSSHKPRGGKFLPTTRGIFMKTGKTNWMLALPIATVLFLTQQAHALFTPELTAASNQVALYLTTLTNAGDGAEAKALNKALKALAKPSASVAQDYDLFVSASLKLGQFGLSDPNLFLIGSNTFVFFLNSADEQIDATAARIAALNDFVKTKKAASNQLAQARATLTAAETNANLQLALSQGRVVFTKITTANRLAAIGEAHSGFAPDSLDGKLLSFAGRDSSGTEELSPSGTFKENGNSAPDGTFTFTRSGLNSGTVVLNYDNGAVTTAQLNFKTTTSGKFAAHTEDTDGEDNDNGTFTIE